MRRGVRALTACLAVVALPLVSAAGWRGDHLQRSRSVPLVNGGDLVSVSAVTPTDVWAIGTANRTDILHWNGSTWSRVNSPSPEMAVLEAVSADSAHDAWAVGFDSRTSTDSFDHVLIEHWNGRTWSVVRSRLPGRPGIGLTAVAAVSRTDAWAVGDYCPKGRCQIQEGKFTALILHWNGKRWSKVPALAKCASGNSFLHGVAAASRRAAWAVGECDNKRTGGIRPLLLRWNGARWSAYRGPDLRTAVNFMFSVTDISRSDAWAVGEHVLADGVTRATLILHWNGTTWSLVPSPDPGSVSNYLTGVSAVSAKDVWATGIGAVPGSVVQILALRWNGSTWTQVPNANGAILGPVAISADRADDAWIVGPPTSPGCGCSLILQWNGSNWMPRP